ncbi:MAG: ThiF family adenylyltransferase [Deltaproteobacteria bacterium]|nr:ThiF family adenylyltransferase [Deltaproteobacteria bacterium]
MEARGFVLDDEALSSKKIVFRGCSTVDPSRPLVVKYPNEYPSLPPNVYSDTRGNYLPRHHNRSSGEICTFGPRRSRWDARKYGVDAVNEAEDVIRQFSAASLPVPGDDAPEPITAELDYNQECSLLIPNEIANGIRGAGVWTKGTVGIFLKEEKILKDAGILRGVIVQVSVDEKVINAPDYYKKWPVGSSCSAKGTLVMLPGPPVVPKNPRDFFDWLGKFGGTKPKSWAIFAYQDQTIERSRTQLQFFGVYIPSASEHKIVKIYQMIDEDRTSRVPNLGGLSDKKVMILGCGSLGSKIAVNLAATGVKQFCLIDAEHMDPGNAVRHEVGVGSFGLPKGYALLNRVNDMNPGTRAGSGWIKRILGDPNVHIMFDSELQNIIGKMDLVVEATGVYGIGRYVNILCFDLGIPALFVGLTNGAWAGEVVRAIPGKTACWMCWVNQYYDHRPPAEPEPPQGVFAPGCNQPTFTGTTYEVGMVANLASWFAVETLLRDVSGRQDFQGDYIRWTGRGGAGTPIIKTEVLPVAKRKDCSWCG